MIYEVMIKYNFLIVIILLGTSFSIFGKNIVVLTSLPKSQYKTVKKLNKIALRKLGKESQFDLIIKKQADQEDLYRYLNDPETVALFWISHGAFTRVSASSRSSIRPSAHLLDYKKDNIAKIFQKIHPNIKFLGIIGCNSAQIIKNNSNIRKDLETYIPTKKVIATWAMRKAIRKFAKYSKRSQFQFINEDRVKRGYKVTVSRYSTNEGAKSLKVFVGKKLVGLMPKSKPYEKQRKTFFIPVENTKKSMLKILFETGQSAFDKTDHFGEISLYHNNKEYWELFAKRDGTPFGTNERIFLYKADITELTDPVDYVFYSRGN